MEPIRFTFPSANGSDTVAAYRWTPAGEPIAVVQIAHGMQEYAERYAPLCDYLCAHGIAVGAHDHLGHGHTAATADDLGYTGEGGADAMIADLHTLSLCLRETYPDKPLILLGHSMGSFVARNAAADFAGDYDGCVFVGTGGPESPTGLGKALASLIIRTKGGRHRSALIAKIAFGSYNKRIKDPLGTHDWVTRDEALLRRYMADPFCAYAFTAQGFYDLFDLLGRVSQKDWAAKLPGDVPVLFLSGREDPVGNYGRGVAAVHTRLDAAGVRDNTLVLYDGMRHEVFNEIGREQAYGDLLAWIVAHFQIIGGADK